MGLGSAFVSVLFGLFGRVVTTLGLCLCMLSYAYALIFYLSFRIVCARVLGVLIFVGFSFGCVC